MQPIAAHFLTFCQSIAPQSKLRLAPTPSGLLHTGNALNFVLNWLAARISTTPSPAKPRLFLRIDDLDADRARAEYVQDVFDSLEWLGLDYDGRAIYQSDEARKSLYFNMLERLRATGLLFACRKSRSDLAPFDGAYPPHFRNQHLHLDEPEVAWRIQTPPGFPLPDFVVRRRDGIPAYQVASLADDLALGITHIIRGADLVTSTEAQRFLASILGEDNFLKINFLHHPLVLGEGGEKLSKSAGATSLKQMQRQGENPASVFQLAGAMLGLEGQTARQLLADLEKKI